MRQLFVSETENMPPAFSTQVTDGQPCISGRVSLVQEVQGRTLLAPIVLKVYQSSFGSYAILGQDKLMAKDCGCVTLKNCTIRVIPDKDKRTRHLFQIVPKDCEGVVLTFATASRQETSHWVDDLRSVMGQTDNGPVMRASSGRKPLRPRSVAGQVNKRASFLPALEEEGNEE